MAASPKKAKSPTIEKLLAEAESLRCLDVRVGPHERGYEVTWRRPVSESICAIERCWGNTEKDALENMIGIADAYRLIALHGKQCACEDCCIARVDLEQLRRKYV